MANRLVKLTESKINKIINDSLNRILKESFNDKRVSSAIKSHGGLNNKYKNAFYGANTNANYDLKNCTYVGYLSPDTVNELAENNLLFNLDEYLLHTNDGCAIVVKKNSNDIFFDDDYDNSWEKKVKDRNKKWGEETNNENYRDEMYISPNKLNTYYRRQDRKKI